MDQRPARRVVKGAVSVQSSGPDLGDGADPPDGGSDVTFGTRAAVVQGPQPFVRILHFQEVFESEAEELELLASYALDGFAELGPLNNGSLSGPRTGHCGKAHRHRRDRSPIRHPGPLPKGVHSAGLIPQ